MTSEELIDYVRNLPKAQAQRQIRRFLMDFIGQDKRGDVLGNRYKRALRRKVGKI